MGKQRVGLEHHVDRPFVGREPGQIAPIEHDPAGTRRLEAGEHPQQGRLAAAGRTEQAENLAANDVEADVIDGPRLAEVFDDFVDLQEMGVGFGTGGVHGLALVKKS